MYNPKRLPPLTTLPDVVTPAAEINTQCKRLLQSDITTIEDLAPGSGGVLNQTTGKPTAVFKDDDGKVYGLSTLCPHLKGFVSWNAAEKSWDGPVHGSRFSWEGVCVMGPAKGGLLPMDKPGESRQKEAGANV